MPGVVMVQGGCLVCGRLFSFHPLHVPSVRVCAHCRRPLDQHEHQDHEISEPTREPICETCMGWINARRAQLGQPVIAIHPRAYEPAEEGEIP